MCKFKSGVVLRNKVVLAPLGNESHSNLLESLNIEDNSMNAMKTFVRVELIPPNGNKAADVDKWRYVVDQDITPDWYDADPGRYEAEFRSTVKEWIKENFVVMAGQLWTPIKTDEKGTYYLMFGNLGDSRFGTSNNNYANSIVRQKLAESELLQQLKKEYGNRLVPITTDLLSLDGLDDYGKVEGDLLAIPTIDLYRECRKKIPNLDKWWWLATPDSTPSGCGSDNVHYVNSNGNVNYNWYNNCKAVRPFWDGRRNKVRETLKLESHYQKNKQPFLSPKRQDKYKEMKHYDRR